MGRLPSFRTIAEKAILACAGMNTGTSFQASEYYVGKSPKKTVEADQEAKQKEVPAEKTVLSVPAQCRWPRPSPGGLHTPGSYPTGTARPFVPT